MSLLIYAARLKLVLSEMEAGIGVNLLREPEKSVLYAVADICIDWSGATMKEILDHCLLAPYSRPTGFRAINNLKDMNVLYKDEGQRGQYRIGDSLRKLPYFRDRGIALEL